jgi:hypothetical protein
VVRLRNGFISTDTFTVELIINGWTDGEYEIFARPSSNRLARPPGDAGPEDTKTVWITAFAMESFWDAVVARRHKNKADKLCDRLEFNPGEGWYGTIIIAGRQDLKYVIDDTLSDDDAGEYDPERLLTWFRTGLTSYQGKLSDPRFVTWMPVHPKYGRPGEGEIVVRRYQGKVLADLEAHLKQGAEDWAAECAAAAPRSAEGS